VIALILAFVLFGVGSTVHWLFIIAAIAALLWLIAVFTGGVGADERATGTDPIPGWRLCTAARCLRGGSRSERLGS
jgi:hypothetical protein